MTYISEYDDLQISEKLLILSYKKDLRIKLDLKSVLELLLTPV